MDTWTIYPDNLPPSDGVDIELSIPTEREINRVTTVMGWTGRNILLTKDRLRPCPAPPYPQPQNLTSRFDDDITEAKIKEVR